MPNYTWNTIEASKEVIAALLKDGEFSFNNFVEMPKELKRTISGGRIDECIAYYLLESRTKDDALMKMRKHNIHTWNMEGKTKKEMKTSLLKTIGDNPTMFNDEQHTEIREDGHCYVVKENYGHTAYEIGEYYWSLLEKYGCYDWYDWSLRNWGTKWDAFDVDVDETMIRFTTAWSMPEPIFVRICEMFPNEEIEFDCEYEDNYYCKLSNHDGELVIDDEFEKTYPDDDDFEYEDIPWISTHTGKEMAG